MAPLAAPARRIGRLVLLALGVGGAWAASLRVEPAGRGPSFDPDREIVFGVERLGCSLVQGVGCGHLLAPTLARIDKIDGVSRSYSNWTGTRLRVSVAAAAEREAVAARVRDHLVRQQFEPSRIESRQLVEALKGDEWRDVGRIPELSSFEFRTHARQRVEAFAGREGLERKTTARLLAMVDETWEKSGEGRGAPPSDADGYPAYWDDRIAAFKAALIRRAGEALTADQVARLTRDAERNEAD